ncbi:MAG: shikimate dehydrogenase, partial [Bacteroidetes bacterium]|nr:shikimate dehydrogenase [Bacteroidota bacterium]
NTTPVGMFPKVDDAPPIPYQNLGAEHILYDLIYNPEETKFLHIGRKKGAKTMNGFRMLQLQAEASWKIWND